MGMSNKDKALIEEHQMPVIVVARSFSVAHTWYGLQGLPWSLFRYTWDLDRLGREAMHKSFAAFLQEPTDTLDFRAGVGRERIYCPHHAIYKVYRDVPVPRHMRNKYRRLEDDSNDPYDPDA